MKHHGVMQVSIQAQPFSTYLGKNCSDRVLFMPTWMPKRTRDLDLRQDGADCQLLSYGAYVQAKGSYVIVMEL